MKAYLLEKDMGNGFAPFELMVKNIDNGTNLSLLEITENGLSVKEYPDVLITDYNDWDERLGVDFDIRDFDPHNVHKSGGITNDDFRHPYVISEVEISGELSDKCKEFLANVDGTITIGEPYLDELYNPVDNRDFCKIFWITGVCKHNGAVISVPSKVRVLVHHKSAYASWQEFYAPSENLVEQYIMTFLGRDGNEYVILNDGIVHYI